MASNSEIRTDTATSLQDLALDSSDVQEFLADLAAFTATALAKEDGLLCSVTLERDKTPATVASSDPRVLALDELQYGYGEGPCLSALRENSINYIPDLRVDDRWLLYCQAAAAEGIGSILSVPLRLEAGAGASMNLYSTRVHAFSDKDIDQAEFYAAEASKTVRLAVRIATLTDHRKNLTAAMQSRTPIDLAAGIIMAQNRCGQDTAMKILKMASSTRNLKLHAVAETVLASVAKDPTVLTHFRY